MEILFNFLLHENNIIFSSAFFLLLFLLLLEGLFLIIGFDTQGVFEQEFLVDNLYWLNKEKIPTFILFIFFLIFFSFIGLSIQFFTNFLINQYIVVIPTIITSLILLKIFGKAIAKIIPQDETTIVSENSYIGNVATLVLGTSNKDNDAEFKLKDSMGREHYFMAYVEDGVLNQGEVGIVTKRLKNGKFLVSVKVI